MTTDSIRPADLTHPIIAALDLRYRQLRRHLHPGVSGGEGGGAQSRADGLMDLVGLGRRRLDGRLAEFPLSRADHHRLVHAGRGLPHCRATEYALRGNDRRLHAVRHRLHCAGGVGLFRTGREDDSARYRRGAARRHSAALRYWCLWRRGHGPVARRRVDSHLCLAAQVHRALRDRRRADRRHRTPARDGAGQLRKRGPGTGYAGIHAPRLLDDRTAQRRVSPCSSSR
jgi:hypothetical protein